MKKRIVSIILITAITFGLLWFLQALLMPKYTYDIIEGRLISEYYDNAGGNDVLFVGDCELYENISPITLWENYGITSYIRGSSQQLIWQSYYLLEEMLDYEEPKVVVFNVLSMKYNEPQKEAYNRLTLDGMKWSTHKWKAVKASMMEDENMLDYIFPILRYHSRWNELTSSDYKYIFTTKKSFHQGFLMRADVRPVTTYPTKTPLADYQFGDNAYMYLDMMRELCEEKGIEFVLCKAPSISPVWYDQWEAQIEDYAEKYGLDYYNFLETTEEYGLDYNTDTYDGGLHLNLSGAEKLSIYFGKILSDNYSLMDHRTEADTAAKWKTKVDFYYGMKDDQYWQLEEYGYLLSEYGGKS